MCPTCARPTTLFWLRHWVAIAICMYYTILLCDQQRMSGKSDDAELILIGSDSSDPNGTSGTDEKSSPNEKTSFDEKPDSDKKSGSVRPNGNSRKFTLNTALMCMAIAIVATLTIAVVITTIAIRVSVCSYNKVLM